MALHFNNPSNEIEEATLHLRAETIAFPYYFLLKIPKRPEKSLNFGLVGSLLNLRAGQELLGLKLLLL